MPTKGRTSAAEPILFARHGTEEDAEAMGRIAYRAVDLDGGRAAEEVRTVLRAAFAPSAVVVQRLPDGGERIVAVLNGALLRPRFSQRLLRAERPYFHNHVRDAGEPCFPTLEEIGAANAGEGLDLFLAHVAVDDGLDDAAAVRARSLLVAHFAESFAGNRLRSVLVETVGWENTATAMAAGFEVVSTYPRWRAAHDVLEREGPHLLRITLERAMEVQNFHSVRLLQYHPPVFRFPPGEQEILRHAVRGMPDQEIARLPGFTDASVASGWTRLLRRAKDVRPHLFADDHPVDDHPKAKSRDRLTLLAHLRNYPEELWPS